MKTRKTRILTAMTAVWLVFIFLLSAQDVTKSSNFSDWFTRQILNIFEPGEHTESPSETQTDALPAEKTPSQNGETAPGTADAEALATYANSETYDPIPNRNLFGIPRYLFKTFVRKAAHFVMFLGLGILTLCTLGSYNGALRWRLYAAAWLFCVLCAIGDEFHQLFVPGRGAQFSDVCLDSVGALTGIVLVFIVVCLRKALRAIRKKAV